MCSVSCSPRRFHKPTTKEVDAPVLVVEQEDLGSSVETVRALLADMSVVTAQTAAIGGRIIPEKGSQDINLNYLFHEDDAGNEAAFIEEVKHDFWSGKSITL